ncbi:MAG: polyphosphate polymerase domain-containing protein [Pedosphaera sp.]|nr:polyphosphate polymerase domain-containing protein [Pedosphaera sp.]
MPEDKMQLQRWELKYVIPEETALLVREFVGSYLDLDEYGAGQPNFSYTIHNLYLDSDDLKIYWGTINGDKNRYKLRLRFYEDNPNASIFFEIKRRINDAILKQRGGVKRPAVESILHGHHPGPNELVSGDPRQLVAVQRFVELMIADRASPRAHVSYLREAWISPTDNSVRVTLDRQVDIEPNFTTRFRAAFDNPTRVFGDLVILELKFTGRFPGWFTEMVRALGLRQCSASKYADGIVNRGEAEFYTLGSDPPDPYRSAAASERKRDRIDRIQNILHCKVPA